MYFPWTSTQFKSPRAAGNINIVWRLTLVNVTKLQQTSNISLFSSAMASSLLSRKRDLIYLVFFFIHIPVLLCVDTYPIWASSIGVPAWMTSLREFYLTTYKDQFFIKPPLVNS